MVKKILNGKDMIRVLGELEENVVGIGVSAFNRIGLEGLLKNFRIICLSDGKCLEEIMKNVEVFSLEREEGKDPGSKRNTLRILRNEKSRDIIQSLEDPHLLFYRITERIRRECEENGWKMIGNPPGIMRDNKKDFREMLESLGLEPVPGEFMKTGDMDYGGLSKKYGERIVIQSFTGSGGKGTHFVFSGKGFETARKKLGDEGVTEVLVTRFIDGPSPSLTGCVTRSGILSTNLQYQLLDIPELMNTEVGSGVFCGHDWTSSDFSGEINEQAYGYAESIGKHLGSLGYRGIFGLDFVFDIKEGRIYPVELNPRLLGSFPVLTMIQLENGEPVLMGFHLLEFMGSEYETDVKEVNPMIRKKKEGAHFFLYNRNSGMVKNRKSMEAGVYIMENGGLKWLRKGYRTSDIKDENEFIIADAVPFENTVYKPHSRIIRIITKRGIMDTKNYKLNEWARKIAGLVYKKLEMTKIQ